MASDRGMVRHRPRPSTEPRAIGYLAAPSKPEMKHVGSMQSSASFAQESLLAVVNTPELARRPSRPANLEGENRALGDLAESFAASPRTILQKLADVALELCRADSAGISILEDHDDAPALRWRALAGQLTPHLGRTLPRALSPCGAVLDRNALQLMSRPARGFSVLDAVTPAIEEVLLIPFHRDAKPIGTIWVASHDEARRFDAEDARLMTSLGRFAAGACDLLGELDRLERELTERRAAMAQLTTADRNKDRLLAILGHELRNQLAPSRNASELLKRDVMDVTTARHVSGIIDRQVTGMTRLIDELLDAAHLRGGHLELHRTDTALADIIGSTIAAVETLVASRNHSLVVDLPTEPVRLAGDEMWLSHALQNLIGNAAKYTDPGGRIDVRVTRDGTDAVVKVSDNGVGLDAAQLEAIFELYVQLGQSPRRLAVGGLGVGLYLTRLVVEGHGGTIQATSEGPGRGSRIHHTVALQCCADCRRVQPVTSVVVGASS